MAYRTLIGLGTYASASLGLYLLLARQYPLAPSLENPRASWVSMVDPTIENAALHIAIYLGLTLLFIAALRSLVPHAGKSASHSRWQIFIIIGAWLACSGVLMAAAPAGESHDIFDYAFRGRMMTEYHGNPLVDVPDSYPLSTPYSRYLAWRKNVDTYGPVWEASSAAVSLSVRQVARWSGWWDEAYPVCPKSTESCRLLILYITGYRLLALLLTGISGWLIYAIVRRGRPLLAPLALAIWLLNPLTLIGTALGGHNDAAMLALVLLCWWLLQRQHMFLGLLALILAAHVKLTALIWLPAITLWILWRLGWWRALKVSLASVVSGLALSWVLYAPFGGWGSLPRMLQERSEFVANSLWRILQYLLIKNWDLPAECAHQISITLPSWLFAIGALLLSLWIFNFRPKRWRNASVASEGTNRILWRALLSISILYLLIGSFWFQHWYVLWVIVPAALLPESRFSLFVLPWLAFGALSSNVVMDFLLTPELLKLQFLMKYVLPVMVTWGPALFAVIIIVLLRQWGAGKA